MQKNELHMTESSDQQAENARLDRIMRVELRRILDQPVPAPSLRSIRQRNYGKRESIWNMLLPRTSEPRYSESGTPACSGFYLMCILRSSRLMQGGSIPS